MYNVWREKGQTKERKISVTNYILTSGSNWGQPSHCVSSGGPNIYIWCHILVESFRKLRKPDCFPPGCGPLNPTQHLSEKISDQNGWSQIRTGDHRSEREITNQKITDRNGRSQIRTGDHGLEQEITDQKRSQTRTGDHRSEREITDQNERTRIRTGDHRPEQGITDQNRRSEQWCHWVPETALGKYSWYRADVAIATLSAQKIKWWKMNRVDITLSVCSYSSLICVHGKLQLPCLFIE